MLWGTRQELQVNKWRADGLEKAHYHGKQQKRFKALYHLFMVPLVILPTVSSVFATEVDAHVSSTLLLATGILNGVHGFLNYGRKQQDHGNFENMWHAFVAEIETEMCKPKRSRLACDVFLQKTLDHYQKLCALEPN